MRGHELPVRALCRVPEGGRYSGTRTAALTLHGRHQTPQGGQHSPRPNETAGRRPGGRHGEQLPSPQGAPGLWSPIGGPMRKKKKKLMHMVPAGQLEHSPVQKASILVAAPRNIPVMEAVMSKDTALMLSLMFQGIISSMTYWNWAQPVLVGLPLSSSIGGMPRSLHSL